MNDFMMGVFNLCNKNDGKFVSLKQANYFKLRFPEYEIISHESYKFGENTHHTVMVVATFDDEGILTIVRHLAKGELITFSRDKFINTYKENSERKAKVFVGLRDEVITIDIPRLEREQQEIIESTTGLKQTIELLASDHAAVKVLNTVLEELSIKEFKIIAEIGRLKKEFKIN